VCECPMWWAWLFNGWKYAPYGGYGTPWEYKRLLAYPGPNPPGGVGGGTVGLLTSIPGFCFFPVCRI